MKLKSHPHGFSRNLRSDQLQLTARVLRENSDDIEEGTRIVSEVTEEHVFASSDPISTPSGSGSGRLRPGMAGSVAGQLIGLLTGMQPFIQRINACC